MRITNIEDTRSNLNKSGTNETGISEQPGDLFAKGLQMIDNEWDWLRKPTDIKMGLKPNLYQQAKRVAATLSLDA